MFRREMIYTKRTNQLVGIAKCSLLFLYASLFIVQGVFSHAIQYNSFTNRYEYCKKSASEHRTAISQAQIEKHKSNAVVRVNKRFQPEAAACLPAFIFNATQLPGNFRIAYQYDNPDLAATCHQVIIVRGPPAVV